MTRGRRRNPDNEICPRCGLPGYYSRDVPSWNSPYKNATRNLYDRSIHADRTLPYCYIGKNPKIEPSYTSREYSREHKEVITFSGPEGSRPKSWKKNNVLPIIIYHLEEERVPNFSGICRRCKGRCTHIHDIRCSICDNKFVVFCPQCVKHWNFMDDANLSKNSKNKNLTLELKKLKKLTPAKNELKWLSDQDGYECLKNLSYHIILTFGEEAVKAYDRIQLDRSWLGEISIVSDKNGAIDELLKRRKFKINRSEGAFGSGKWEQ
jgi:hypothetical protein